MDMMPYASVDLLTHESAKTITKQINATALTNSAAKSIQVTPTQPFVPAFKIRPPTATTQLLPTKACQQLQPLIRVRVATRWDTGDADQTLASTVSQPKSVDANIPVLLHLCNQANQSTNRAINCHDMTVPECEQQLLCQPASQLPIKHQSLAMTQHLQVISSTCRATLSNSRETAMMIALQQRLCAAVVMSGRFGQPSVN